MLRLSRSSIVSSLLALPLLAAPKLAFVSPLSDEAVREAYFLGQRRDETMARFLNKYSQHLQAPETGPFVSSIEFLTPFAQLVKISSQRANYSAQQAEQEHSAENEAVAVTVQIQLTASYPAVRAQPTSTRSGSPIGYWLRPADFWKDFRVQAWVNEKSIEPAAFTGDPTYSCRDDGGCVLTGATVHLEFPAKFFHSDTTTVQVTPPEGAEVSVDFDLTELR
jgi:hypothetical protein